MREGGIPRSKCASLTAGETSLGSQLMVSCANPVSLIKSQLGRETNHGDQEDFAPDSLQRKAVDEQERDEV